MARVAFEDVSKVFGDGTRAVDGLDLEIADGEFVVLVGPSGCGKTTALRMVAGLEDISAGAIRIGDRVVNALTPKSRDIAMVFQSYALYPHLSVYDNIAFALKLKKMPKDEIRGRVSEAAHILDLEPLLARKPRALSAASGSESRWGVRSCASRRRFSWTSRSRTSTRSCGFRCERISRGSRRISERR